MTIHLVPPASEQHAAVVAEPDVGPPPTEGATAASVSAAATKPSPQPVGHSGIRVDVEERPAWQGNGFAAVAVAALVVAAGIASVLRLDVLGITGGVLAGIAALVLLTSVTVVQPGQTRVLQFFGRYGGTVRRTGLVWTRPLTRRRPVSTRVRNFETSQLKVNDRDGNPIDVAAIVVWQVADTAKALFAVESYTRFITTQSEAALRHVAGAYPYDGADVELTLRGSTDEVAAELAQEVAARIVIAGVEIIEVRISHLAYAAEIAQAMLQRQQAAAVVAARTRIVEGAVGMVELALAKLSERGIVELDNERKAAMVSNLLVVLCGDSRATPIVNTGTIYQ
jgi:regulator of protease activity HflC (stomatin/prohibitin superfamily)